MRALAGRRRHGNVKANGTSACIAYKCIGNACGKTCATTDDCLTPFQCIKGSCGDGKPNGAQCASDSECKNLHCVDAVCCNTACVGTCQSCLGVDTGGADGTCKPVAAGTDPWNECTASGTQCGANGMCDGAGKCTTAAPKGATCGATSCVGASVQGQLCDGDGACVNSTTPIACSNGYVCTNGACPTSCTADAQCAGTHFCSSKTNTCVPKLDPGVPCKKNGDCDSDHCIEGVCCKTDCTGTCKSCLGVNNVSGQDGTCGFVKPGVVDPAGLCKKDNVSTCQTDGTCDGGGACRLYPPGTVCGSKSCAAATIFKHECDGFGMCKPATDHPCGAFACDAAGVDCKGKCTDKSDCATGKDCDKATGMCGDAVISCVDATHVKNTAGNAEACPAGYTCSTAAGGCNKNCSTNAECDTASGYTCVTPECKKAGAGGGGAAGAAGGAGAAGAAAGAGGVAMGTAGAAGATGGAAAAGKGGSSPAAGAGAAAAGDSGGCGCEVAGASRDGLGASSLAGAVALLLVWRRRRARAA